MNKIGLGDNNASLVVYCQNIPPLEQYQQLTNVSPMTDGEIKTIADKTGNHWRKIFNVYAKFIFELKKPQEESWQAYRDKTLLRNDSDTLLMFSPYKRSHKASENGKTHIIMGKQYASSLLEANNLLWLSHDFAIDEQASVIVCPYFDYRQLSNEKITKLCGLVNHISRNSRIT